ncbi:MAG: response regulator [Bythopirellula sp.]|nr:response regulator [Bythopirellula sp.]
MSTELTKDSLPGEIGSSDAYNRFQLRRVMDSRYEPITETSVGISADLLRVLVVDDHHDGAKIMAMLVNAWGHDCRRAHDGVAGLALAAEFQPDIILLDLLMPNMSGIDLAVQLRQQACFQNTLIIAVTGCTDGSHRQQCEDAGVDLYLVKPVSPVILKSLLCMESAYVARSRSSNALPAIADMGVPPVETNVPYSFATNPPRFTHGTHHINEFAGELS